MKTATIGVRVSPTERMAWEAAAHADGRTLSAWIARRCAGLPTTPPSLPEAPPSAKAKR